MSVSILICKESKQNEHVTSLNLNSLCSKNRTESTKKPLLDINIRLRSRLQKPRHSCGQSCVLNHETLIGHFPVKTHNEFFSEYEFSSFEEQKTVIRNLTA